MIKNIVFDMGNVLVAYDEDLTCRQFMEEGTEEYGRVKAAVFGSQEWVLLDMGVISEEEGLRRMKNRLKMDRERELAEKCFRHWHEFCMWTIPGAAEVIRELKGRGYGIYLCSNASVRLLTCYPQVIPAVDCFDGILFSAEEKLIKPQRELYQRFFERFGLRAEECFFVDDQPVNIEGAAACGMQGCCHEKAEDASTLRRELEEFLTPPSGQTPRRGE